MAHSFKSYLLIPLAAASLLTACGREGSYEEASEAPENQFGFWEASSSNGVIERVTTVDIEEPPRDRGESTDSIAVAEGSIQGADSDVGRPPQIAYIYQYGFRLPGSAIAPLQQHHADLCEAKGPDRCRIISMDQSGSEGDYVYGTLQLAVAAPEAREFGKQLSEVAEGSDGEVISSSISGEDLSKQIVDTEARLRARTVLRDRLMDVLRTRSGTVEELVEAERGVARVNEEIDQAQSWLVEMRGRVAFSRMTLSYASGSPSSGGFMEPIRNSVASVGSILGTMIGGFVVILTVGLPLLLLFLLGRFAWLRGGSAIIRRKEEHEATES